MGGRERAARGASDVEGAVPPGDERWSRRRFVVAAVAGAGATLGGVAVTVAALPRGAEGTPVRFFDVVHDESVYVTMTDGVEFVVTVKETGTGAVLETHDGVTATTLLTLQSDHVAIVERG